MRTPVFILAAIVGVATGCSTNKKQEEHMNTILDVPNPEVRRKGVRDIVTHTPEKASKETLSLLVRALDDPDAEVRALAAGGLHGIAYFSRASDVADRRRLDEDANARSALLRATRDVSIEVRQHAILALSAFPQASDIEAVLLRALKSDGSPKVRSAAVQTIGAAGYSSADARNALVKALDDVDLEVKGWAAKALADSGSIPDAALPALAAGLGLTDRFAQHNFIIALSTFGSRARPYLEVLQHLLSKETDDSSKAVITEAIRRIEG